MLATGFMLVGLLLTWIGAFIAAKAVIITNEQADILSGTYFDGNNALKDSLIRQSNSAKTGLSLIAAGTGLQFIGTLLPIWSQFSL